MDIVRIEINKNMYKVERLLFLQDSSQLLNNNRGPDSTKLDVTEISKSNKGKKDKAYRVESTCA